MAIFATPRTVRAHEYLFSVTSLENQRSECIRAYHWPPEVLMSLMEFLGLASPVEVLQHDLNVDLATAIWEI